MKHESGCSKWPPRNHKWTFQGLSDLHLGESKGHSIHSEEAGRWWFPTCFCCHPESFFGNDPRIDLETFLGGRWVQKNFNHQLEMERSMSAFQPPEATVRPCTVGSRLGHQRCVISRRRGAQEMVGKSRNLRGRCFYLFLMTLNSSKGCSWWFL